MNRRSADRLVIASSVAIGITVLLSGLFLFWWNRSVLYSNDVFLWSLFTATTLAYTVAGAAIVRRSDARVIGWLCLCTAAALELSFLLSNYGIYAVATAPGALPAPGLALALAEPLPLLYLGGLILIAHVFPTGHVLGRRWRWLVIATCAGMAVVVAGMFVPHRITEIWSDELSHAGASATDPLGIPALAGIGRLGVPLGGWLFAIGAIGAVISLFVRRKRASIEERQQIKWLAFVAGAALGWIVLGIPIIALTGFSSNSIVDAIFWMVITPLVALGPPIAIGIGIVKYRLFDIDVVIRKTVVVAVIAFTLTVLYLGVLALATLAPISRALIGGLLLVLTFNPIRRAARSIGDRVAYGRRASGYEVLSEFSERVGETYADDDVLPRMATVLANGTGAASVTVWLRVGDELRPTASTTDAASRAVPLSDDALPDLGQGAVEVRHNGELLGALSVEMPANDPLDPARRKLIAQMAAQAGLVLRNVKLIEELKASRQRLVAAQDEERRKIERNIHDGAQQQLVALAVQLRLAETLVGKDPDKERELLSKLGAQANDALEDLRDLARGIYPPLLQDKGLTAALEVQARKAAVPVSVEADGIGRYDQAVESAVYFCTLEALNNVAKYAGASSARVRLAQTNGHLTFSVTDDGRGFDASTTIYGTGLQGMADRLEAIGGELAVTSAPGEGTTVTGKVPA